MKQTIKSLIKAGGLLMAMLGLAACAHCPPPPSTPADTPLVDYAQATAAYDSADSRESLLAAIHLLQRYAQAQPNDYASRARLANAYTLLGAGYSSSGADKAAAYRQAMAFAEQAFMTKVTYRQAREGGQSFEQALALLDQEQLEALEFWKTAMFYSFREADGIWAKLIRYPRLKQAVAVMQRIEAIDRNAYWGNNLMSWGIYYLAQPEFYGGDRDKARQYLAEAASVSQRNIVPRWGRAKYFAVAMNDPALFRADLEWVAAQPLDELVGFKAWNRVLLIEAKSLLAQQAVLFGGQD
jgi:tetratricopeptide (TPR) repeat protein